MTDKPPAAKTRQTDAFEPSCIDLTQIKSLKKNFESPMGCSMPEENPAAGESKKRRRYREGATSPHRALPACQLESNHTVAKLLCARRGKQTPAVPPSKLPLASHTHLGEESLVLARAERLHAVLFHNVADPGNDNKSIWGENVQKNGKTNNKTNKNKKK